MRKLAIGIDLGGTNIKGIILDETGKGYHVTRIPTEAHKDGSQVLQNILSLIDLLIEKQGAAESFVGVGIGTPGFVDSDGTILGGAENIPGWNGMQLYEPIFKRFGIRAVAANDVTVMAFAESKYGAGKGVKNMVCFALGTGVGGGIVINGELFKGSHGMAGELGHIVVETNGIACNCGQNGCLEQYASATGIVNIARKFCDTMKNSAVSPFAENVNQNPDKVTSKMIYDYVNLHDPVAILVHETATDMLARAIGIVSNIFSPDRIVLGGGVMMAGQVIVDTVNRYAPKYCWPAIWDNLDIKIAQLGEDAGVLGAAAMVFEEGDS